MYPSVAGNQRFKPLRYKSFLGEEDPQDRREAAQQAAIQSQREEAAALIPPPPTFSENELEEVRARAYEEGRAAGQREERETLNRESLERENAMTSAFQSFQEKLNGLGEQQQSFMESQKTLLTQLALHVAQKIAGRALAENPLIEIETMIAAALRQLGTHQPINVYVHPAIVRYMESAYAEKAVMLPKGVLHISFHGDENLAQMDDCRVEWPNGSMHRSQSELWAQVESVLVGFDPLAAAPMIKTTQNGETPLYDAPAVGADSIDYTAQEQPAPQANPEE